MLDKNAHSSRAPASHLGPQLNSTLAAGSGIGTVGLGSPLQTMVSVERRQRRSDPEDKRPQGHARHPGQDFLQSMRRNMPTNVKFLSMLNKHVLKLSTLKN